MPPTALIHSIESVRRRARLLSVAYGAGIVLASAVGLLVGVVLVDYILNLPAIPRILVMLIALASLGYLAYRFVARPATNAMSLSDVAGRLERAFPQFEDRLRSTVNFADGHNPGSTVLQDCVIQQATQIAKQVDLSKAVVAKPAAMSVSGGVAAVIFMLVIALGLMDANIRNIIASRLITPFSAAAWPKRVMINVTSDIPDRVPVGQKIELSMKLDKGDKPTLKPIVYYQIEGGMRQQVFMTRGEDGHFHAALDARLEQAATSGKLTAWIEAGDDSQMLAPITIVPRLSIKQITARVTPPAYVPNRAGTQQDMGVSAAVAAEGSEIAIATRFNKVLAKADPVFEPLVENTELPGITWTRDDDYTAIATFIAEKPLRFRIRATDTDGFSNTAMEEYELVVRPDANMTIQLENPRRSEERTATAFVPMQAVAEDDCGVEWVTLVVERLQPSPQKWEIPLVKSNKAEPAVAWNPVESTPERTRSRLNYKWELEPLKLNPGDVLEYQMLARDNFDLNGRRHDPVGTSKLRITIISQEELTARVTDDLRQVKNQAATVRRSQAQTKQETGTIKQETDKKPQLDAADKAALERLSQQQSSAAASTKQLAGKMQNALDRMNENRSEAKDLENLAKDVKETLEKTSEGPMKDAAQDLNNTSDPRADSDKRDQSLTSAETNQQKALDNLDKAMSKMENIGSLQSTIAEIAAILKDQENNRKVNEELSKDNLGKKPEQMSDKDRQKLQKNADDQEKLASRTEKAIENMEKQGKQMEKSDPSASDAMKSAAQKAQSASVTQNQQRAAQQAQQNQQAGAQQAQQMAELGLQNVLNELREAERRELARLREQLAKLQQQVAELIRRQAGHNLDNLLIQGEAKLASLPQEELDKIKLLSQRKTDQMKAPETRAVTSGQELTERNTRDISKQADADPKTAEIGARLTSAASKMERAIVSLRAANVVESYPPQVEALALLLEAKQQVDDQKKDADDKAEQQKKDAIRARYEKVRADQDKVNVATARVEKARDAKGNILRTEWQTIAELPKTQAGLAEEVAKIEEDLAALGSIVYIWANKDIKNSMDEVKEDLVASKTATPTQSEQARIIEQLDAMIKNLEQEKPEEKFEKDGGGGGGGGNGAPPPPKMPTEAELKMLKSLQEAVNKSTIRIDAAKDRDAQKLLALGNRQGELRNLLGSLIEMASKGALKLDPEPDNKEMLPEEATAADVDQQELKDMLLGDGGGAKKLEQDVKLVGTRMARSRMRLALNNDPGNVTQEIQKRIILDMDSLIEQAKQQQQQQSSSSSSSSEGQKPQPGPQQQAQNQGANQPGEGGQEGKSTEGANQVHGAGAGSKPRDLKELTETAAEWGGITPRVRDAVIESKGEVPIDQYRKLIEDYYEALSKQGSKR